VSVNEIAYGVQGREGRIYYVISRKEAIKTAKQYGGMAVCNKNGIVKQTKRRKIFLWFFLALQVAMIVWIVSAVSSSDGPTSAEIAQLCGGNAWQGLFSSHNDCVVHGAVGIQAAHSVGKGLAVGVIVVAWVIVDFLAGITYGIYRLATR